jgi:hypothetical protein
MPWKDCSVLDERLQFVARRLAGEPTADDKSPALRKNLKKNFNKNPLWSVRPVSANVCPDVHPDLNTPMATGMPSRKVRRCCQRACKSRESSHLPSPFRGKQ